MRTKRTNVGVNSDALLRRRCRQALAHHRQAAAKDMRVLPYALGDLLALARFSPTYHYCRMPLSFGFHFDHVVPIARTPQAHRLNNIVCCCAECNLLKGQLDGEEFRRLLEVLSSFDPRGATDVRRRLVSGGQRYASRRRPASKELL